jgi:hypothetical protein
MKMPKGHRFFYALIFSSLVGICLMYIACKKSEESSGTQGVETSSEASDQASDDYDESPYGLERTPVLHEINLIAEKPLNLPFSTGAHKKYLNDPIVFENIPDGGIPNDRTAVVGSDVCLFYHVASISLMDDLDKLPQGEKIPFATILPLGDELVCKDSRYDDLYKFQDNYNYFYTTTWQGKQGIVFGADLYGIDASNEENRMNALLYKDSGYFRNFYPVTGYDTIRTDIRQELETYGLAFQEVKDSEYRLRLDRPDDMISLYIEMNRETPVFVTTDLAAHANHLVFDRLLQYCEEEYFFPQLVTVVNEYIKALEQKKGQISDAVYSTSILYFQTAQALLALAPKKVEGNDYYKTITYQDVNAAQVLRNYPQQVANEIEQMNNAVGLGDSAVFPGMKEDYSQYKVRGHYTKNGILGAYFRALMWFGRINFNLGGETDSAKEAAKKLAPAALFITDLTENSPPIKKLWQSLFDPITELIGASDDISFYELAPLWNRVKGADFAQWYNDPAKLETFVSKEYKELRAPAISGSSLLEGSYDGGVMPEDRRPPLGWRLFGQRYTLDSEIHHYVSPPRLMSRNMVSGLDIMKVFGSQTADRLLMESDYSRYPGLENVLNSLQQNLMRIKDDYWFSTYYTNILYQIKTQAVFENGAGFYFTEKPGWNLKAMNAAHGTWAELRHDTILYVKQVAAERGGGNWEPTFRTKPLPEPVHYIEPNVPFWITSAIGIQKLYKILEKYDFLDGKAAQVLASLHGIFVKAAEISGLEADDKEVSGPDLAWIRNVPNQLSRLVVALLSSGSGLFEYTDDTDSLRMALVADVFTNAEIGLVLETAVGIPFRLYIPLNDKQGGKRIAIGYGFSYYEFAQPISNRLNNDEWKAIVYKANPDMKKYLPFWMQGKINPAR